MSEEVTDSTSAYQVATFYKFVGLSDVVGLQQDLRQCCSENRVKGTILLADEGVNATIAGSSAALDSVVHVLQRRAELQDVLVKRSACASIPFERLKVRIKKEIVTIGLPEIDPTHQVGTYIAPAEWNDLLTNPDVTVIDTRNDYEVEIGSFVGAHNPQTESFRDFPDYVRNNLDPQKDSEVALFCTGGIRCEKATAHLLSQGFEKVYHLEGGILNYLRSIPEEQSRWEGECFVFDDRVAVQHGLKTGSHTSCRGCGHPLDDGDKMMRDYEAGICCTHCVGSLTSAKRKSLEEKRRQEHLQQTRFEGS